MVLLVVLVKFKCKCKRSTRTLYASIKYSTYDAVCDIIYVSQATCELE